MLNSLRPKKIQACVLHFVASCWKRQHFDQCRVQEMGFSGCVILPSFGIQSLCRSKLCFGTVNPFTLRDRLGSNLLSPYHLSVFWSISTHAQCPDLPRSGRTQRLRWSSAWAVFGAQPELPWPEKLLMSSDRRTWNLRLMKSREAIWY